MTINLDSSGGLFPIYRKVEAALAAVNLAQQTTVPTVIETMLAEVSDDLADIDTNSIGVEVTDATTSFRSQTNLQNALKTFATKVTINRVTADAAQVPENIASAITELIRQMEASSDTVERNVATASASTVPANAPTLLVSAKRGDGKTIESMIPETIVGVYSNGQLRFTSGTAETTKVAPTWPKGSGTNRTIAIAETGLLTNESFDLDTARAGTPDDWQIDVGVPGTSVVLTQAETQTITITGGPTSGTWTTSYTRASDSFEQTTEPLSYAATAADVQAELATLTGLESVEVTATGTLPSDVVYTVTFTGVAGDQTTLTTAETFDQGSISVAETQAGSAFSQTARALAINGDGAELTKVRQALHTLGLSAATSYGLSVALKAKTSSMSGNLTIEVVDGAGTVIADDEGTNNSLSFALSTISNSAFAAKTLSIRLPSDLPDVFYLQFRVTTAIDSGQAVYLDDCILTASSELYAGGPVVNVFKNLRDLQAADRYEITVANDFAGKLQTLFVRFFGSQLPSATSGAETISD